MPSSPSPTVASRQNDIITLNKRFALDHQVKMAISHALAQVGGRARA